MAQPLLSEEVFVTVPCMDTSPGDRDDLRGPQPFCDSVIYSGVLSVVQERSFSGCKRGFETQGDFKFWPVNPWNWVEEQSPNLAPFSQTQLWLSLTTE